MKAKLLIEVDIRDKSGKQLYYQKQEANSLVRGYIDILYVLMSQSNLNLVRGHNNTTFTATNTDPASFDSKATAGDVDRGIIVGTGSTAVTITDYALGTPIAHGSGAGELAYLAATVTTPGTVGSTHSFTISRGFTNNSGNSITVNEVGLYSMLSGATALQRPMIDRTLMTFSIAHGATGTVTYTFQVSL